MESIEALLAPDRVVCNASCGSKKRALELLSALLAKAGGGLSEREIFESLLGRERLGSTGLGHGIAIPHGRVAGIEHATGAFLTLDSGIDFDSPDGEPVSMLFSLLVPEACSEDHLKILATLAEMFSDAELRNRLREQSTDQSLLDALLSWSPVN